MPVRSCRFSQLLTCAHRQSLPAISTITEDNHVAFQGSDKIVLIAYLDEADTINKDVFSAYAESHRDDYMFGVATDPTTISSAGVTPPAVVMYKTFDEGRNDFTKSFTSEALTTFVSEHAVPLLDEISPENFALYAEAGIPLAYIFIPADDANRVTLVKSIEPVAREYKGKINFVWIDTNKVRDRYLAMAFGNQANLLSAAVCRPRQVSQPSRAHLALIRHPASPGAAQVPATSEHHC